MGPKVCVFTWEAVWGRFLCSTNLRRGVFPLLTNVTFVKSMRRMRITFFFIVIRQGCYGSYCSHSLGFRG